MIFPPSIIYVRSGWVRIPFPLFVLWPLILVLAIVLVPLGLIAGLVVMTKDRRTGVLVMKAVPYALWVYVLLRGTIIDVAPSQGKPIVIRLI